MKKLFLSLILILLSFNLFSEEIIKENNYETSKVNINFRLVNTEDFYKVSIICLQSTGMTVYNIQCDTIQQAEECFENFYSMKSILTREALRTVAVKLKVKGIIYYFEDMEVIEYLYDFRTEKE